MLFKPCGKTPSNFFGRLLTDLTINLIHMIDFCFAVISYSPEKDIYMSKVVPLIWGNFYTQWWNTTTGIQNKLLYIQERTEEAFIVAKEYWKYNRKSSKII